MWNPITEGMDYIRGTDTAPAPFPEQPKGLGLDYIASLLHEPIGGNSNTAVTKAEVENPQAFKNYVNRALDAQNKYVDQGVNAQNGFVDKGVESANDYVSDVAERAEAINQAWNDYVNKNVNAQGEYVDKVAGTMSGAVDQYAEDAGNSIDNRPYLNPNSRPSFCLSDCNITFFLVIVAFVCRYMYSLTK